MLAAKPATEIDAKASRTIFSLTCTKVNTRDTFLLHVPFSSSDFDSDSDIDLENSGYDIATNPVNQAPPTDDEDKNNPACTLLVLNE